MSKQFPIQAEIVLKKYMEWVNRWSASADLGGMPGNQIAYEDWFKYGETKVVKIFEKGGSYFNEQLIVMTAGYGDEGGPALLVAKLVNLHEGKGRPKNSEWMLRWLMHEFDTMAQMIWNDSKWENGPEA